MDEKIQDLCDLMGDNTIIPSFYNYLCNRIYKDDAWRPLHVNIEFPYVGVEGIDFTEDAKDIHKECIHFAGSTVCGHWWSIKRTPEGVIRRNSYGEEWQRVGSNSFCQTFAAILHANHKWPGMKKGKKYFAANIQLAAKLIRDWLDEACNPSSTGNFFPFREEQILAHNKITPLEYWNTAELLSNPKNKKLVESWVDN